jgi:hypothetical protein
MDAANVNAKLAVAWVGERVERCHCGTPSGGGSILVLRDEPGIEVFAALPVRCGGHPEV